jgi:hypothetical protein
LILHRLTEKLTSENRQVGPQFGPYFFTDRFSFVLIACSSVALKQPHLQSKVQQEFRKNLPAFPQSDGMRHQLLPGFRRLVGYLFRHFPEPGNNTQIPSKDGSELRITFEHAVHSAMPPDTSIL